MICGPVIAGRPHGGTPGPERIRQRHFPVDIRPIPGQNFGLFSPCCVLPDVVQPEGYPSGQRGQTVNLLAYAFGGSNPPPSTISKAFVAGMR